VLYLRLLLRASALANKAQTTAYGSRRTACTQWLFIVQNQELLLLPTPGEDCMSAQPWAGELQVLLCCEACFECPGHMWQSTQCLPHMYTCTGTHKPKQAPADGWTGGAAAKRCSRCSTHGLHRRAARGCIAHTCEQCSVQLHAVQHLAKMQHEGFFFFRPFLCCTTCACVQLSLHCCGCRSQMPDAHFHCCYHTACHPWTAGPPPGTHQVTLPACHKCVPWCLQATT
jgi:hypothetical protein